MTSLTAPALPADSAFMNAIYHLTGILPTDPGEHVGSAYLAARCTAFPALLADCTAARLLPLLLRLSISVRLAGSLSWQSPPCTACLRQQRGLDVLPVFAAACGTAAGCSSSSPWSCLLRLSLCQSKLALSKTPQNLTWCCLLRLSILSSASHTLLQATATTALISLCLTLGGMGSSPKGQRTLALWIWAMIPLVSWTGRLPRLRS